MLKLRSQLPERLRGAITWIRMNEDEDAPTMLFNDLVKKIDRWATVHREEVDKAVAIKTAALQRHKRGKSDQPRNKPTPPWFKKQGGATGKQAKGGPKSGPSANMNELTCWNCGRKGHVKADCPFPVKCPKCGKTGHTAKECNSNVELRHCNICGKQGHLANQCPQKGQQGQKSKAPWKAAAKGAQKKLKSKPKADARPKVSTVCLTRGRGGKVKKFIDKNPDAYGYIIVTDDNGNQNIHK
jgi:hypothetical protein